MQFLQEEEESRRLFFFFFLANQKRSICLTFLLQSLPEKSQFEQEVQWRLSHRHWDGENTMTSNDVIRAGWKWITAFQCRPGMTTFTWVPLVWNIKHITNQSFSRAFGPPRCRFYEQNGTGHKTDLSNSSQSPPASNRLLRLQQSKHFVPIIHTLLLFFHSTSPVCSLRVQMWWECRACGCEHRQSEPANVIVKCSHK